MPKREIMTNNEAFQLRLLGIERNILSLICNCSWSVWPGNFRMFWVYGFINEVLNSKESKNQSGKRQKIETAQEEASFNFLASLLLKNQCQSSSTDISVLRESN